MNSLENLSELGEGAERDQRQRHQDGEQAHEQRGRRGVLRDQLRGLLLNHRLVGILVRGRLPVAAAQEHPEDQGRHERGQRAEHEAVEQPGAERDLQQAGDGDRGQSRDHEDVAGEDAGPERAGHVRQAGRADEGRGRTCHRRCQDDLHVDVDRGEDRRHRRRQRVREPVGADTVDQQCHHLPEGAHRVEQRPDEHAEADEQADLAHDLAEACSDGREGGRQAHPGRDAEIQRADDQ